MKFIDLWDEEYMLVRSPLLRRIDGLPEKKLSALCENYQSLVQQRNELLENYKFITDMIEENEVSQDSYTKEDIKALIEFFKFTKGIDDYERLEIYKLGYHDCMNWMQMISLYD